MVKQNWTLGWVDYRRSPPKTNDAQVREAMAGVVKEPPMVTGVFGRDCVSMDTGSITSVSTVSCAMRV